MWFKVISLETAYFWIIKLLLLDLRFSHNKNVFWLLKQPSQEILEGENVAGLIHVHISSWVFTLKISKIVGQNRWMLNIYVQLIISTKTAIKYLFLSRNTSTFNVMLVLSRTYYTYQTLIVSVISASYKVSYDFSDNKESSLFLHTDLFLYLIGIFFLSFSDPKMFYVRPVTNADLLMKSSV